MLIKVRDVNIEKAFKREINLNTRIKNSKKKYTRKVKYNKSSYKEL